MERLLKEHVKKIWVLTMLNQNEAAVRPLLPGAINELNDQMSKYRVLNFTSLSMDTAELDANE